MQAATVESLRTRTKKTLILEDYPNWIGKMLAKDNECLASSLSVVGKPLIVYNMEKLVAENPSIDHIMIPNGFTKTADLLQKSFPHVQIDKYSEETHLSNLPGYMNMSLSSAVIASPSGNLTIKPIVYPWDVLKIMLQILDIEVRETSISKDSTIGGSTILKGPCVIDEGVVIDDFNKLVGPLYIGKNSKIGTGNLVRNCTIGDNSNIGFSCEVARTVMMGRNKISHHDIVLDSVIGQDTWMGAFVGTTNLLLNNDTIKYKLGNMMVSTGLEHFGTVMGYNCAIGAGTIILPGRSVSPNSILQAGTILSK